MKNIFKITTVFLMFALLMVLVSFTSKPESYYKTSKIINTIEFPEKVKTILENKCFGCHTNKAKGKKSKMKMNFDKFTNGEYTKGKMISKLGKIVKILGKQKMPPQKFLNKFPKKELTDAESLILVEWAKSQSEILTNN